MSASTHPVAPEGVMALLDGELSPERFQAVSAHIGECAECHEISASLREASQSLARWTVPNTPSQLEDRVLTAAAKTSSPLSAAARGAVMGPRRWGWKRWTLMLATAGCASLLLLAISIPNLLRSRMAANEASAIAQQRAAETEKNKAVDFAQVEMSRGPMSGQGRNPNASTVPMIARIASLSIVVKDFESSHTALDAILARHKGYAASLNVSTPQGAGRALQASLRIPAPQLAPTISELKALGRVENETQSGEEVTQQHADLVARLKNSRETEQRLQDVLRTRTGRVKDVLEVEQEIARVRGEIEQMEAEQKALEHRVDFATVDLKLAEEYKAQLSSPAPSVGMQIRNATVNGFRNAFESLLGIVLCFAEAGPTLILWLTILAIPAWLLWRRYRRAHALGSLVGA